jgi:hypothetical protein
VRELKVSPSTLAQNIFLLFIYVDIFIAAQRSLSIALHFMDAIKSNYKRGIACVKVHNVALAPRRFKRSESSMAKKELKKASKHWRAEKFLVRKIFMA